MFSQNFVTRRAAKLIGLLALLLVLVAMPTIAAAQSHSLVMTQIYLNGGKSQAKIATNYYEIFNAGYSSVNLAHWTLQYQASTSTSPFGPTNSFPLGTTQTSTTTVTVNYGNGFNGILQPGQYLLVQGPSLTSPVGTQLSATPTTGTPSGFAVPDVIVTLTVNGGDASAISAFNNKDGKMALVASESGAPACTGHVPAGPPTADFAGWGAANCYEGTAAAPTGVSNTSAAPTPALVRGNKCGDTDVNSADFALYLGSTYPVLHNTTSALDPCPTPSGVQNPTATGGANPSSIAKSAATLLTVTITSPGANPTSTYFKVQADLSAIGGSATQVFYDDGTHGDLVAGDKTYSYSQTVTSGTAVGPKTLPVTVIDDAFRVVSAPIHLTVTLPPISTTAIHDLYAQAGTYLGTAVNIDGVLTGIVNGGYYVQAPDSSADADPLTPEGIFVSSAAALPDGAVVGTEVVVTGTVAQGENGILELSGGSAQIAGYGSPLPTPIPLTTTFPNPTGGARQLAQYQAMRVSASSLTTVSPTGGPVNEVAATATTDGTFYAVVTGLDRTMRERGADISDVLPAGAPANVPRFDGNPERIRVASSTLLTGVGVPRTALDVTSSTVVSGVSGIVDATSEVPTLLLEPTASATVSAGMGALPVVPALGTEFTVATLNLQRFKDATSGISADGYTARVKKASLAIVKAMLLPDVIGVQQVATLTALQDIAAQVSIDAVANGAVDPKYQAYLIAGNDAAGLNNGYLVKSTRVHALDVQQFNKTSTFTSPADSSSQITFEHPPLVLHAGLIRSGLSDYEVTIVLNDLAPASGINAAGTDGEFVRAKREAQAEAVAAIVQGHQSASEQVIVLGGFQSYGFNDGYVDVLGAIIGSPAPSDEVVLASPSELVSPNLVAVGSFADAQKYSVVESGNAAATDHVLATGGVAGGAHASFARINADFPETLRNDSSRAERVSDHDPLVAYFNLPGAQTSPVVELSTTVAAFGEQPVGTQSAAQDILLSNTGSKELNIAGITLTGSAFTQSTTCGAVLDGGKNCIISVVFHALAAQSYSETLSITDDAAGSPHTVALSGKGVNTTATATPSLVDFGSQVMNLESTPKAIIIHNTGSTPMAITNISADWVGNVTNGCSAVIAAGASCTVNVTFAPTTLGTINGSVVISGNFPTPLTVSLTGVSITGPTIVLSPTTLDLGGTTINTTSAAKTVTITNTGGVGLTFTSIQTTGNFAVTNDCPATLAVSASCKATITFTPTAIGTRTGTLVVTGNSTNSPQTVPLTGKGLSLGAISAPATFDVGGQALNGNTTTKSITVTNSGESPLTISAVQITGAEFTQTNTCVATIAPTSTCTISVTFKPTALGARTGSISITASNASNSPQTIALKGTGTDFTFVADPTSSLTSTIHAGQTAIFLLNISSSTGFKDQVTFTCSGAPAGSTCVLSKPMLDLNSSNVLQVRVSTTGSTTASVQSDKPTAFAGFGGVRSMLGGVMALLLGVMLLGGRRMGLKGIALCSALCLVLMMAACGGGSSSSTSTPTTPATPTPAGSYTLTITGTSGTLVHTASLTMVVQ